jgi:hypothetical protein
MTFKSTKKNTAKQYYLFLSKLEGSSFFENISRVVIKDGVSFSVRSTKMLTGDDPFLTSAYQSKTAIS